MDNRRYNIFFHLHTVSGITISLLLFVIFFCGAFTLFRKELTAWETSSKSHQITEKRIPIRESVQQIIHRPDVIAGSSASFYFEGEMAHVQLTGLKGGKTEKFRIDELGNRLPEAYKYTGATLLYWLHFYWQFGLIGYYIAGLVSLFFFLAVITGIWIHWEKIRTHFFLFRTWVKPKQMWTDLHTALGVISFPFQFLYALTGSMFGLGVLIASVSAGVFYEGDVDKFYKDAYPYFTRAAGKPNNSLPKTDRIFNAAKTQVPDAEWERLEIAQLRTDSCYFHFHGTIPSSRKIAGRVDLVYNADAKLIHQVDPGRFNYLESVPEWMVSWHYADFRLSGWSQFVLRLCWFVLAIASCAVIISGILIWEKGREKKSLSPGKLRFNRLTVRFFLSASYAFLPAAPAILIVQRLANQELSEFALNAVFAIFIVSGSGILWFCRDHKRRFLVALLVTCVLLVCMPCLSLVYSGFGKAGSELFFGNLFCLFLLAAGVIVLFIWRRTIVQKPVNPV